YPNEVREILDKQSETGILLHNIYDLKPLKSFVYGRTILLGDATTKRLRYWAILPIFLERLITFAVCLTRILS
ncbi:hypothetical protein D3235_14675, partial [Staphylococcus aureus]